MTGQISVNQLESFIIELLQAAGLTPTNARVMAKVYIRATLRGVGHHDIYDLTNRLTLIESGRVKANPNLTLLHKFQAVEGYDGDNGPGEICCTFIMEQAMRLADEYGIGFCTVRHSNHFLAASPYAEQAAERDYLGLIYSRAVNSMGAPGSRRNFLGNNPFGFAVMSDQGFPLMLDISMAYSSYGKLNEKIKAGERVPEYWGMNADHQPTSDPKEILQGGMVNPLAGHKGFGLALLGEIMTGVLSNGEILDETNPDIPSPETSSQTAIAIKIDALMPIGNFQARVSDIINRVKDLEPDVKMPGRQSWENKSHSLSQGINLNPSLVISLNEWATKLKVLPLPGMTGPK
jgi:LDH2 family malate/lactate/ureidoglycolate dehydrogenase